MKLSASSSPLSLSLPNSASYMSNCVSRTSVSVALSSDTVLSSFTCSSLICIAPRTVPPNGRAAFSALRHGNTALWTTVCPHSVAAALFFQVFFIAPPAFAHALLSLAVFHSPVLDPFFAAFLLRVSIRLIRLLFATAPRYLLSGRKHDKAPRGDPRGAYGRCRLYTYQLLMPFNAVLCLLHQSTGFLGLSKELRTISPKKSVWYSRPTYISRAMVGLSLLACMSAA